MRSRAPPRPSAIVPSANAVLQTGWCQRRLGECNDGGAERRRWGDDRAPEVERSHVHFFGEAFFAFFAVFLAAFFVAFGFVAFLALFLAAFGIVSLRYKSRNLNR